MSAEQDQWTKREQAKWLFESINVIRTWVLSHMAAKDGKGSKPAMELTPAQIGLIQALEKAEEATIKELSGLLGVSAPSVSAMVDRLVDLGAVTREQHPEDRRVVIVRPTQAGLDAVAFVEEHLCETIEQLLDLVGEDTARKWCEVYEDIRAVVEEQETLSNSKKRSGKEAQP